MYKNVFDTDYKNLVLISGKSSNPENVVLAML